MQRRRVTPDLGREIEAIIDEAGAALVVHQNRTFVVVEVDAPPITFPKGAYHVTDPAEIADLEDALDDTDNPVFAHEDAVAYLRQLREKRRGGR